MDDLSKDKSKECAMPNEGMSRRSFIDYFIKGGIFVTLVGLVAPALVYLWPVTREGPTTGKKEVGSIDEIPVWGSKKVVIGGSAIIILRTPKELKAFSAICTHLGCIVEWDEREKQIVCPCHAGFFDSQGRVISGPPPRPLPTYNISVIDGKIFVSI